LASGRTLHDVCLDDDMPSQTTVQHWVNDDRDGFCARYFAARDDGRNDWMERRARDGRVQLVQNREHIQRSKLRWEARRWEVTNTQPKTAGKDVDPVEEEARGVEGVHDPGRGQVARAAAARRRTGQRGGVGGVRGAVSVVSVGGRAAAGFSGPGIRRAALRLTAGRDF
jgi:hypothetical protein